jgi:outer membrane protein assembly factor BamB
LLGEQIWISKPKELSSGWSLLSLADGTVIWSKSGYDLSMIACSGKVIAGVDKEIKGLDSTTGDLLWKTPLEGFGKFSFVDLGSDRVLVAFGHRLFIIDTSSGKIIESQPKFNCIVTSAILLINKMIIQVYLGEISAFSVLDIQKPVWTNPLKDFGKRLDSSICAYQDSYIMVGSHGHVGCINVSTGELIWKNDLRGSIIEKVLASNSTTVHMMKHTLVVYCGGKIFGLETLTGKQLWKIIVKGNGMGMLSTMDGQTDFNSSNLVQTFQIELEEAVRRGILGGVIGGVT